MCFESNKKSDIKKTKKRGKKANKRNNINKTKNRRKKANKRINNKKEEIKENLYFELLKIINIIISINNKDYQVLLKDLDVTTLNKILEYKENKEILQGLFETGRIFDENNILSSKFNNKKKNRKKEKNQSQNQEVSSKIVEVSFKQIFTDLPGSIIKIKINNNNNNKNAWASGFFVELEFPIKRNKKKKIYGVLTNNHVLSAEVLDSHDSFEIYRASNENEPITVYIRDQDFKFTSELMDVTFIEVNKNTIEKEIKPSYFSSGEMKDEDKKWIFIPQFPKMKFCVNSGILKIKIGFNFISAIETANGSSGSPVVILELEETPNPCVLKTKFKVIAVHKSRHHYKFNDSSTEEMVKVSLSIKEIGYALGILYSNKEKYDIDEAKKPPKKLTDAEELELNEIGLEFFLENQHENNFLKDKLFKCTFSEHLLFYRTNYSWYYTILEDSNKKLECKLKTIQKLKWICINLDSDNEDLDKSKFTNKEYNLIKKLKESNLKFLMKERNKKYFN